KWLRPMLSFVAELGLRAACRLFSGVVAATPAIAESLSGTAVETTIVQNFPIENELKSVTQVPWSAREPAIAYVGGVTANRGAREMVEAMALVPATLCPRLRIAGEIFPSSLRDELSGINGWRLIEYAGVLSRQHVADMLGRV